MLLCVADRVFQTVPALDGDRVIWMSRSMHPKVNLRLVEDASLTIVRDSSPHRDDTGTVAGISEASSVAEKGARDSDDLARVRDRRVEWIGQFTFFC
jgi:hypothetical protein